jgi:hypothetical protein
MVLYDQESERDCLSACIKTILQRHDVPDFWCTSTREQDRRIREWLKHLTCEATIIYFNECGFAEMSIDFEGYAIAWGPSPRHKNYCHAVVVHSKDSRLYIHHDPHLSRSGIDSITGSMQIYPRMR